MRPIVGPIAILQSRRRSPTNSSNSRSITRPRAGKLRLRERRSATAFAIQRGLPPSRSRRAPRNKSGPATQAARNAVSEAPAASKRRRPLQDVEPFRIQPRDARSAR
jgi:hypothetical protein